MNNERSLAKEITEGFEALKSMRNNEPVAWMQVHYKDNKPTKFSKVQTWEDDVPLYTHPVKELTDEEIEKVRIAIMNTAYWCADENMAEAYNAIKVCCSEVLAILRKAQR